MVESPFVILINITIFNITTNIKIETILPAELISDYIFPRHSIKTKRGETDYLFVYR